MRKDLKRAVALVKRGYSYAEAAVAVGGITRNAVAGACHRAGVTAPLTKRKLAIRWAKPGAHEKFARITSKRLRDKPEHLEAMREGAAAYRRENPEAVIETMRRASIARWSRR